MALACGAGAGAAWLRFAGLRRRRLAVGVGEVVGQLGFAGAGLLLGARRGLLDDDIRLDAGRLDRAARRRVVARRGQPHRAVGAARQRDDGLHRAFAERARAHDGRALMILQGAGNDLGGRGRAAIDQHDDRLAVDEVAAACVVALDVVGPAAAGGDDLAAIQERVANRDRLIEQAARIVAQIEHIADELLAALAA